MTELLSLALDNHPGALADVIETLAKGNINVDAIDADALGDFGAVRLSVSDLPKAMKLLQKHKVHLMKVEAIEVELSNRPGELSRLLLKLAKAGVNVVSLFGTAPHHVEGGRLFLRVNDRKKALAALGIE